MTKEKTEQTFETVRERERERESKSLAKIGFDFDAEKLIKYIEEKEIGYVYISKMCYV